MKRLLIVVLLGLLLLAGCSSDQQSHDIQYTVDRVELGENGEQWVVVEVYDATTGEIAIMDIKVEEGYVVD